ncbi:unnamed protein product [Caenorhabditis sp. 36 PRJEB53466]|nr:unnamed protein product [Caenorhabditis sp. 36 PRJEB53466]
MLLPLLPFLFLAESTAHLCYSCYGETVNSTCFQNARGAAWVECEKGECQVWSLYSSDSPANVYMFERSCSGVCQPGCVQISDMGHRFTSCSTCCSANFCNVGSSGSFPSFDAFSLPLIVSLLHVLPSIKVAS